MTETRPRGPSTKGCAALVEELPGFIGIHRALFDTPRTFTTLVTLERGEAVRATDLAHAVFLDPSTVTRQIAYLRAQGWVDTRSDPHDGRAALLDLTPAGARRLAELRRDLVRRVQQQLGDWSEEELCSLAAALHRYRPPHHSGGPVAAHDDVYAGGER
jgi:DNA-binding MarR family transcriptional regulator